MWLRAFDGRVLKYPSAEFAIARSLHTIATRTTAEAPLARSNLEKLKNFECVRMFHADQELALSLTEREARLRQEAVPFSWLFAGLLSFSALRLLKKYLKKYPQPDPNGLIFRSQRNTPLLETNVLHNGLHPALRALSLPKGGLQAFRRGCNRR